ncbi:MAG: IS1634 family transposase [Rhodospirillaceae bacterium]|nr:IS1634 family transposase [Rhodospirillaceae bacterium]
MFIRVKSTPNSPRRSVQIVRSVRQGDKVRQVIVRHVGVAADGEELQRLRDLAEFIKARIGHADQPSLFPPEEIARQVIEARRNPPEPAALPVDLSGLREERRLVVGIHEVFGTLYGELGLDTVLPRSRYRASHDALFHTVMARIANPASKRASVRRLEEDFGVQLPLERVYRMMDHLDDARIERLHRLAKDRAQGLLNRPLDVLLFDCTTLYFESFEPDRLRQPGYSKDGKFRETQVLLALMVTPEGLPVGYEVLPGASFEGHSLVPTLRRLRRAHDLRQVTCVADRGMMSEDNMAAMEAEGMHFIVGAKLKQLPGERKAEILDAGGFGEPDGDGVRIREVKHKGRRIVVGHSPKRAAKDARDRERALGKLRSRLARSANPKGLLGSRGYHRFLRVEGEAELVVDEARVAEQARWDGLHGVMTNLTDMPARDVLGHYAALWQVERTFRVTKHDLKVRPIFHWTERRIRAHLAIAFMTLLCVRHLSWRTRLQQRALSEEAIRRALTGVQCSVLHDRGSGRRYVLPSAVGDVARRLQRVMGLKRTEAPFELTESARRHRA